MIAKKDYELIKAIKNHKCCGKSDSGASDGSSASGEITIDDVVKFIHDDLEKNAPPFISEMFPYTTWDDIPNYDDARGGTYCKSNGDDEDEFSTIALATANYAIGIKKRGGGTS